MASVTPESPVDVMLTPQFYTMKRESLPLKYAYQAKKIAPSLFDGLIDAPHRHAYFVFKEDGMWVFIAYDMTQIADFLSSKGIAPEMVSRVFFAQQALSHFTAPVLLGDKEALVVIDGTVTVVPASALPGKDFISVDESFRPAKGVRMEAGSSTILDRKQAFAIATVLFLFGVVWIAEGTRYNKTNASLQEKLEHYYETYPALQSTYTRESVAAKYRSIDKAERAKRQVIGKIAGLIFKGVTLEEFEMDTKAFKAVFRISDLAVKKRFEALLKSAGFSKSSRSKGETVVVEGKI
jgi:hypothetical protein